MKRVAIISTQGVPAQYGGFESLAENLIGEYCSAEIEYTVFCSGVDMPTKMSEYKNAKLKYIPFRANGWQSVIYDTISLLRVMRKYDVILILGLSVPILGIYKWLCRGKIIINTDGLSQFRDKFNKITKWYLSFLKRNTSKQADIIVADNQAIKDFVKKEYNRDSALIAYGGDHAIIDMPQQKQQEILEGYNLQAGSYYISVCRIEPENNCHLVLDAVARSGRKMIFIGNWNRSEYGRELRAQYSKYENIIIQDPIYDIEILYALRGNAKAYIHGHSVGGTNPSLVEAMFFGRSIYAYDVIYNKETTFMKANYFNTSDELIALLQAAPENGVEMRRCADSAYTWQHIVNQYEALY